MWFYVIGLSLIILFMFGVSLYMVRTIRHQTELNTFRTSNIDIDELASKIADLVLLRLESRLESMQISSKVMDVSSIQMDESIIPSILKAEYIASNTTNLVKEEKSVDKELSKSKAKLAKLMKGKK